MVVVASVDGDSGGGGEEKEEEKQQQDGTCDEITRSTPCNMMPTVTHCAGHAALCQLEGDVKREGNQILCDTHPPRT
jgi:hypothetical protein